MGFVELLRATVCSAGGYDCYVRDLAGCLESAKLSTAVAILA